jgi:peptidoglycan hydrolase CwlO-like protein
MTNATVHRRSRRSVLASAVGSLAIIALVLVLVPALRPGSARAQSLGQLQSELGATQSHAQGLQASLSQIQGEIGGLTRQISLVQSREQAVRAYLQADQTRLASARRAVERERARLALLRARLARAQMILARQLVSDYESTKPDLVSVVLNAHGFDQLLQQLSFLGDAEHAQQQIIAITRIAKRQAQSAAARLGRLERGDLRATEAESIEARALAGMNALLASREAALGHIRAAQQTALAAAQARGSLLRDSIARVRAEQAAAARAAAALAAQQQAAARRAAAQQAAQQAAAQQAAAQQASTQTQPPSASAQAPAPSSSPSAPAAPSGGSYDGWAIPYAIVLCESGGQNLPPNGAGASGYYQIIPSTWRLYGGTGPAAYLAPLSEQSAVAARIWNGGAGASAWVCSGIVGIH